jgi:hypothetical protein
MGRVGALAIGLTLALPTVALAQTPTGDSVVGSAATHVGSDLIQYTFDVRAGASGESPSGTVTLDGPFGNVGPLVPTCLSIDGNRARMIVQPPGPGPAIVGLAITVEDNGAGQDGIEFGTVTPVPTDCPAPSQALQPTVSGDVTVTDAPPPPTTYAQCRLAGWVKYRFAGHAACNSYVHERARQACIFERVAHGIAALRLKYGLGPSHDHAMRHCVRLRTGW